MAGLRPRSRGARPRAQPARRICRYTVGCADEEEARRESWLEGHRGSYVCGLLHGLGDIILAYTLPDEYLEMQKIHAQDGLSWEAAQDQVLGARTCQVGQHMAKLWAFPKTVVKTLEPYRPGSSDSQSTREAQLHHALAQYSHGCITSFIVGSIRVEERPVGLFYADNGPSQREISESERQGFVQFLNQARLALRVFS